MASENQQQEFELLTDDDDWSDSPKAGKKNSLWNTNAVVVKSNDLLTAKTGGQRGCKLLGFSQRVKRDRQRAV